MIAAAIPPVLAIAKMMYGNEIEVEEYESFSLEGLDADPEEIIKRADQEEEDDRRLEQLVEIIRPLYQNARGSEKAVNYWNIGMAINDFDGRLPRKANKRESWLRKTNILDRLHQKLQQGGLSTWQMESMINFNKHWKIEEISPKITWSFYQELALKSERLPRNSIKSLERLIIEGKITEHKKLREHLEKKLKKKNGN